MDDMERAWRDGFASGLNAIRAAHSVAEKGRQLSATQWQAAPIVDELVVKYIELTETLTEDFVEKAREFGFAE